MSRRVDRNNMMLDAALEYASRGWPVLPLHSIVDGVCTCLNENCGSPGKHPRTLHGVKDATFDPSVIESLFKQWPDSNLGIATGKQARIFVVDIDPDKGGEESLSELTEVHGALPHTAICLTGGGGSHIYLRRPEVPLGNRVGFRPGIDVRDDGGYVVAPPSNHISGNLYAWEGEFLPQPSEIPLCPAWLLELLTKKSSHGDKTTQTVPDSIPNGERNDTLFRLACGMRRLGLTASEIYPSLQQVHKTRCNADTNPEPMADREIMTIAKSASRYKPGDSVFGVKASYGTDAIGINEILEKAYDPIKYIVDELIPEGFGILGGRPKVGKSFMMLQLAVACGTGSEFLNRVAPQSKTLYMALEDSERRIHNRLVEMVKVAELNDPCVDFLFDPIPPDDLERYLVENEYRFVMIDTLSRYYAGILDDHNDQAKTTEALAKLHDITRRHNICILVSDHHKKPSMTEQNLIDDIMGSTGKVAVPDFIIGLYKKRGSGHANFRIEGRDIKHHDIQIEHDALTKAWKLRTNESGLKKDLLEAIESLGGRPTLTEIADFTGKNKSNISKVLNELAENNVLLKEGNGEQGSNASVWYSIIKSQ